MKRGTYGYKRLSIEPRWSHSDILRCDRGRIVAYYKILQNSLLQVRMRYKRNEERYIRVQTIIYRTPLVAFRCLEEWPRDNNSVLSNLAKFATSGPVEVQTK